jgi:hypothetical protein
MKLRARCIALLVIEAVGYDAPSAATPLRKLDKREGRRVKRVEKDVHETIASVNIVTVRMNAIMNSLRYKIIYNNS